MSSVRTKPVSRLAARTAFYAHLWLGVIFTGALLVISATGILLNHKREIGLMPDVSHSAGASFRESLSLDSLAMIARASVLGNTLAVGSINDIDRMDVRPRNGYVKVRMRDNASTEVTVDLGSGEVLNVGRRGDVFLEKLHSGEAFGNRWVLLSDAAAIALVVTLITGYWLWLVPKLRRSPQSAPKGDDE